MSQRREPLVILASRSPRRLELLSLLVPRSRILVLPPASAAEPGFEGLTALPEIISRVRAIAEGKRTAVEREREGAAGVIVAADTVIVGGDDGGGLTVLGQPPAPPEDMRAVRDWFRRFYFGRTHLAVSAVSASDGRGTSRTVDVTTRVTFSREREDWLEWYLATDEHAGKAGGYAIQGLAGVFVERVEGSLSNVIGLPVAETCELLAACGAVERPDAP